MNTQNNKQKIEHNSSQKLKQKLKHNPTSKTKHKARNIIWTMFGIILIAGLAIATTTITENTITSENVTFEKINEVLYVDAGVGSDLELKINQSRDSGGGIVMLPPGTYTTSGTINLSGDVIVKGAGVSSIIKASGDYDVFLMCGGFTRLENLQIKTDEVAGYNSSAISFVEECVEKANWLYVDNVRLTGKQNNVNQDKAISLIDNGGNGITWVLIKNVRIFGYRYGLYLETNHANAFVNGNTFENINFIETNFAIYENMTLGSGGGIIGNVFNVRMNGDANSEYFAHIEGENEFFHSIIFDPTTFNSGIAYNITNKSREVMVIDSLLDQVNIINNGKRTNLLLSNVMTNSRIELTYLTENTIVFKNNLGDKRMDIDYDNTNIGLDIQDRNDNSIIYFTEGTGEVKISKGILNMTTNNITMRSPDGTEYSCGVANGGALTCS